MMTSEEYADTLAQTVGEQLNRIEAALDALADQQNALIEKLHDHGYLNQCETEDLIGRDDEDYPD